MDNEYSFDYLKITYVFSQFDSTQTDSTFLISTKIREKKNHSTYVLNSKKKVLK